MASSSVEVHASNPFRDRILAGEVCAIISVKVVTSNEIAMMTKTAGIHGTFIDMEHSANDLSQLAQLILACNYVFLILMAGVASQPVVAENLYRTDMSAQYFNSFSNNASHERKMARILCMFSVQA